MADKVTVNVAVTGKNCIGCLRHKRELMLTLQDAADDAGCKFNDWFLTREQAESLIADLKRRLSENDKEETQFYDNGE